MPLESALVSVSLRRNLLSPMPPRLNTTSIILLSLLCSFFRALAGDKLPVEEVLDKNILPVLEKFCFDCHDNDTRKGDLSLEFLRKEGPARLDIKLLDKVREQVRIGEMPPQKKAQPTPEEKQALLDWIGQTEQAVLHLPTTNPGSHKTRRLTRYEYNYTLRDLLGVKVKPGDDFPADGSGGEGFQNNADTLFIPSLLIEKFISGADAALAEVFGNQELRYRLFPPGTQTAAEPLRAFLLKAYRRPPADDEVKEMLALFYGLNKGGASFDEAMRVTLKAVLMSPKFMLLQEKNQTGAQQPWQIDDYELASRLSYFLWSSMPDTELFNLAAANKLKDDNVLTAQVRRMLADPKAEAFTRHFAGSWLKFEELFNTVDPDRRKFPEFNDELRHAMYDEAFQFSDNLFRRNGNVLEFLDSDYSYLNEQLAKLYGIPGVTGREFRQVKLNTPQRGGVLGMGATLATTAYPQRTSPVLRGKWVLEQLLGTPPPPPPPNVSKLPEDDKKFDHVTLRQKLEQHRADPACAGCHRRMDPPGFGLENYNAIGRWRDNENNKPLDTTATFPDGRKFTGVAELRKLLMQDKEKFTRTLCTRLLGFALGRGLEVEDQPTLLRLQETLRNNGYHSEALIMAIVKSYPFQYRRNIP